MINLKDKLIDLNSRLQSHSRANHLFPPDPKSAKKFYHLLIAVQHKSSQVYNNQMIFLHLLLAAWVLR